MKFLLFFFVIGLLMILFFILVLSGGHLDSHSLDKGSSFECGFYSFSLSGVSFSMSFFSVSLIFIIFDVEILLLCFYPLSTYFFLFSSFYLGLVLIIIFFATIYEWVSGVLSWV